MQIMGRNNAHLFIFTNLAGNALYVYMRRYSIKNWLSYWAQNSKFGHEFIQMSMFIRQNMGYLTFRWLITVLVEIRYVHVPFGAHFAGYFNN